MLTKYMIFILKNTTVKITDCMEDIFHEIVKYPPSGYNKDGIYTSNDWTSISDIGKMTGHLYQISGSLLMARFFL